MTAHHLVENSSAQTHEAGAQSTNESEIKRWYEIMCRAKVFKKDDAERRQNSTDQSNDGAQEMPPAFETGGQEIGRTSDK